MKVSVLLPTRKHPEAAASSVASLRRACAEETTELEVLCRVDDDDDTVDALRSLLPNARVIVGPRLGYTGFHIYLNELAALSSGDWLLLWNDDGQMTKVGWDTELAAIAPTRIVLPLSGADFGSGSFPCLPRQIYRRLGYFGSHYCVDTQLEEAARALGIAIVWPYAATHINHGDEVDADKFKDVEARGWWTGDEIRDAVARLGGTA